MIEYLIKAIARDEADLYSKKQRLADLIKQRASDLGMDVDITLRGKPSQDIYVKGTRNRPGKHAPVKRNGFKKERKPKQDRPEEKDGKRTYRKMTPALRDEIKQLSSRGMSTLGIAKAGKASYQVVSKVLKGKYDSLT